MHPIYFSIFGCGKVYVLNRSIGNLFYIGRKQPGTIHLGAGQFPEQPSPNFQVKKYTCNVETALPKSCHAANTEGTNYGAVFFSNNPQWNWKIVHSLRVPYFSSDNMFVGYYLSLNACYKTRQPYSYNNLFPAQQAIRNNCKSSASTGGRHSGLSFTSGISTGSIPITEIFSM